MSVTTADCELLGRGPVHGSADSDSLAALVRQLSKQQQRGRLPGRRCTVSCSRDAGLEIVPYQRKRPDDEGFESDEDLASLGSYEDPTKRKMSSLAAASVAAGAGSDSANSSGVSEDSDDADAASLKGRAAGIASPDAIAVTGNCGRETYGLADVAFCHTDASALPGIAVWVIKNRRPLATAGLEAIVVQSRDNRLQSVCKAYQEHSRRLKLEPKPWSGHSNAAIGGSQRRKVTLTATPEVNRYNLVQRTDTDGVTHIEVTAGPAAAIDSRRSATTVRDGSPSSIISISTPESPGTMTRGDQDEDEDEDDRKNELPPQRPERRKHRTTPETGSSNSSSSSGSSSSGSITGNDEQLRQKVVRGQFIRVNVNHCAVVPPSSPETDRKCARPTQSDSGNKPITTTANPPRSSTDRLWSTADYDRTDGRHQEQHRRPTRSVGVRTRSRSSGPGRRSQPLQMTPSYPPPVAFSRYPTADPPQQPSFGNRFFGKLREMTTGNQSPPPEPLQPAAFRRRNSVGESATANFYQYFSHNHHYQHHNQQPVNNQYQQQQYYHHHQQQQQQQRQQAKNGGNLKSVIKKSNKSQPYQHAYDEPKKVTFSAYATVQVVD